MWTGLDDCKTRVTIKQNKICACTWGENTVQYVVLEKMVRGIRHKAFEMHVAWSEEFPTTIIFVFLNSIKITAVCNDILENLWNVIRTAKFENELSWRTWLQKSVTRLELW